MIIVMSSRLPQQGKDTAVEYLAKEYGTIRVAFADKLKKICFDGGWNGDKDEKGRQLLIDVGLAFRKYDHDTWIKLVIKDIKKLIKEGYAVAISDCRFLNEINLIRKEFTRTKIVHIGIDSDEIGDIRYKNEDSQKDFSKMKFDYEIKTTSNKNELYKNLDKIILQENKMNMI